MKIRLTYIISNINKALAFEWVATYLDKEKFELSFILLNPADSTLEQFLKNQQVPVYRITYRGKKDLLKAIWQTRKILKKLKSQVVHTHLFDANVVGLLAAKSLGIKKRIFTRHHGTIHHVYFPRAVYYDKFVNSLATDIVAISENVRQILIEKEGVKAKKIQLIHHGFDLEKFSHPNPENVENLHTKYQVKNQSPVVGVIARYTHWKGVQYIIPAFEKLLKDYPDALLILANAQGDYKNEIQNLLQKIPTQNYLEIAFEEDLFSLYQLFNYYVHVPIDAHSEAFGQTYIEALAAGIPSVFSLAGIAAEFIEDKKNALVVPFQDSEAIYQSLLQLIDNQELRMKLIEEGRASVQQKFNLTFHIQQLSNLYQLN